MLPFPIICCQGRETEREGELEKIKERERRVLPLPCFGTIKRETETKFLPPHLPFLIFGNREE